MTDHDKALEAAARAVDEARGPGDTIYTIAQAAITAYLAQREADGFVMVLTAYVEAVSLAEMYLRTGMDTCERCGHETATANLDAAYELRDACAMLAARPKFDPPAST